MISGWELNWKSLYNPNNTPKPYIIPLLQTLNVLIPKFTQNPTRPPLNNTYCNTPGECVDFARTHVSPFGLGFNALWFRV